MGIKLFSEFEKYNDIGPGPGGQNLGGFYKLKTSIFQKEAIELFYIKTMAYDQVVNEYISSNIASLVLGERAPVVDLTYYSNKFGTISIGVISKVTNGFKTLDDLAEQLNVKPHFIEDGYFVDKNNKTLPYAKYLELEITERSDLKVSPPIEDIEDINIIATYLAHADRHTSNAGAIVKDKHIIAAIIDFSKSLSYGQSYKIVYSTTVQKEKLCNSYKEYKVHKYISGIGKLVSQEVEIMKLLDSLFLDLYQFKILSVDEANEIKRNLIMKLDSFKNELTWLKVANMSDELLDDNNLFSILSTSNMNLVSDQAIEKIIDLAVKQNKTTQLIEYFGAILSYKNYYKAELCARIKYDKFINFEDEVLKELAKDILPIAIEYKKQAVVDKLLPIAIINAYGSSLEESLISTIRFNDKNSFYKLLPNLKDQTSLFVVSDEAINNDRVEFFDKIYSLLDKNYYSPTYGFFSMAFKDSIYYNKPYFSEKYLAFTKVEALIESTNIVVPIAAPDMFIKIVNNINKNYDYNYTYKVIENIVLCNNENNFKLLVENFKNATMFHCNNEVQILDFAFQKVTYSGNVDMFNTLLANGLELNKSNFFKVALTFNYKLINIALLHVINNLFESISNSVNNIFAYEELENNIVLIKINNELSGGINLTEEDY